MDSQQLLPLQELENQSNTIAEIKPFLRWAGAKNWLVKKDISTYLPSKFKNYHEPFLGGASIFFHVRPKHNAYLSDLNPDLINTYVQVRDNLDEVIEFLGTLSNTKESYYAVRNQSYLEPYQKAAQFIYLNKLSYNGIYRVNKNGIYNVPYGYRKNVDITNEENLRRASECLKNSIISSQDFSESLKNVEEGDLVFIDPPYTVMHENNGFIEYNQRIFSWEDQVRLAENIRELLDHNVYFILTNASHDSIFTLYKGIGNIHKIERRSHIGGKGAKRGIVNELLISNVI